MGSEDTLLGHTTFIMENCDGNLASFWFNSFTMGDSDEVYLHCEVDLCDNDDEVCPCVSVTGTTTTEWDYTTTTTVDPLDIPAKKRRSVRSEIATGMLKVGPISIGH